LPLHTLDQAIRLSWIFVDHPEKNPNDKIRLRASLFEIAETSESDMETDGKLRLAQAGLLGD